MKSKGQVTVFIIIGVILVLLVALFLMFKPKVTQVQEVINVPLELQPVYSHVDDCLKQNSLLGLQLLGAQGGVIFVNGSELSTYYGNISYGYYEGKDVLKSIPFMENEVSQFLSLALPNCVDFSLFNNFNISTDDISVETNIISNEVIITVEYPIHASTLNYEGNIDRFIYYAPVRLGHIHDVAKNIVNNTRNDPDNIDLSYLTGFKDVNISFIPVSDSGLVYTITDDSSAINGLSYLFMFANRTLFTYHQ